MNESNKKAILPTWLKYRTADDLVRLGGKHDGGYIISKFDAESSKSLLSFGINSDWTFEKHFHENFNVPIIAVDYSTKFKVFLRHALEHFGRFEFLRGIKKIYSYYRFKSFFYKNAHNAFVKKFVGVDYQPVYERFSSIFSEYSSKETYIKMDIEGAEYRCLDDIIRCKNQITGIVIEFHDCDLNLDKIRYFYDNIDMQICHIHVNNYGAISENGIPHTLEITFSKNASFTTDLLALPHYLDAPNDPNSKEIHISFN